ncbi:cell envelope integrity protein TolA [Alteromonas gilva]|uniref:Cell envelope integrity protein TolA n=1 Tax=Alteromonas gilva TaxID=2987522 RepID=A0ABT5L3S8_9ALTE|nr:cell envelope integrity protein TolA [Alteromonas gilva]MDC8831523.1 cell envelope integrity protein TolA [Alteromonas gilva]
MTTADKSALKKSLGLHALLLVVLLISVSLSSTPVMPVANSTPAPVIKATFIDAQAIADQKRAQAQAEAQARAEEQRQQQQAAEQQRRREAAARKAREKKAREAAEAKRQSELRRLAEQKARERKEREAAEKAEAARKAKEAKERAEMERIMQEQLAQEQAAMQQQRRKQVLSEVDRYQIMIQQEIMKYLNADFKGKSCRLNIRLATTGLVTKVTIIDGDPALCRAAQSAVLRPDRLPVSDDPAVYAELKDINLKVEL